MRIHIRAGRQDVAGMARSYDHSLNGLPAFDGWDFAVNPNPAGTPQPIDN
jgi:hypothetical protein